jgi:hypothetical protein
MHLRYRIVLPLVALCLALAIPAFAAKPAPTFRATPDNTPTPIQVGNVNSVAAACQLGVLPPAANAFGYILPPDDEYYTYVDPANCAACPGGFVPTNAHAWLYFTEPCQIPAFVGIVNADLSDPNCPRPNPFDVICPDQGYVLTDNGILGDCIDFSLPLACSPANLCITHPVFLKIRFEQGTCASSRPAFCGPPSCTNCRQFNIYPGSPPGGDDLCALLSPYSLYGAIMYVEGNCCPVPNLPGSWGKVKTLYR